MKLCTKGAFSSNTGESQHGKDPITPNILIYLDLKECHHIIVS